MSNALDVSKDLGGSTKSNAFEDFVAAIRGMTVQVLCVDMYVFFRNTYVAFRNMYVSFQKIRVPFV